MLQKGRTDLGIVEHPSKVFESFLGKGTIVWIVFTVRPLLHVMYDTLELGSVPEWNTMGADILKRFAEDAYQ